MGSVVLLLLYCSIVPLLRHPAFLRKQKGGGEGEIRTPGPINRSTVFETAAFNRSATSPRSTKYFIHEVFIIVKRPVFHPVNSTKTLLFSPPFSRSQGQKGLARKLVTKSCRVGRINTLWQVMKIQEQRVLCPLINRERSL